MCEEFFAHYTPKKIKEHLDEHVIGQESAKTALSIMFYEHVYKTGMRDASMKKDNLLFVGPSGCGKTELLRALMEISPVPIAVFDASGITESGWKGDKKIHSISEEVSAAAMDFAERKLKPLGGISSGITLWQLQIIAGSCMVFLDEFDKMLVPRLSSGGENVSSRVQGEMLKFLEDGTDKVRIPTADKRGYSELKIDYRTIPFVCAGAFASLTKDEVKRGLGFGSKDVVVSDREFTIEDVIEYGATPELAGRLSYVATLHKLSKDELIAIMKTIKKSPVREMQHELKEIYGIEAVLQDALYEDIADICASGTGARAIRGIITELKHRIIWENSSGSRILIKDLNTIVPDPEIKVAQDSEVRVSSEADEIPEVVPVTP